MGTYLTILAYVFPRVPARPEAKAVSQIVYLPWSENGDLSSRVTVGGDAHVSKSKGLEFQGHMLVQTLRYLGYSSAHLTV